MSQFNEFLQTAAANLSGGAGAGLFAEASEQYGDFELRRVTIKLDGATAYQVILKDGADEYILYEANATGTVTIHSIRIPVLKGEVIVVKTTGGAAGHPVAKIVASSPGFP